MRLAIVGATALGVASARLLIDHGHDVVFVEKDRQRIDELSGDLDCGFIQGDGSRPHILREVGPKDTQVLLSLSDNDQDNIISSLVGRTLGFAKVITKISDPEFEHVCVELSLTNTISADQITARKLVDSVEGRNIVELSTVLRGDVRFVMVSARAEDEGALKAISLPKDTKVLFGYRDGNLVLLADDSHVRQGDDLVLVTRSEHLDALQEKWGSHEAEEQIAQPRQPHSA